ncbi:helix-turn-helix domain-containing protein [Pyruvatibacter mobilis]|uniref:helix-turn-helix domain-containing protein n=1 Tax=Pyruvatibacter mobilis TaxID=1712261 RepID=UPI003C7BFDCF
MDWKGEFYIGETWLVYRGRAADNRPHAHATLQLTVSLGLGISISDDQDLLISGSALCVKAGKRHTLHPSDNAVLVLIEPQSPLAHYVQSFAGDADISRVDPSFIAQVNWDGELETLFGCLELDSVRTHSQMDKRLMEALEFLRTAQLKGAISAAAKSCGLSEPRLRVLAQEQLGVPLSKWLIWQATRRSARAMAQGASLADAAYAGGFSDQAHLTRTMGKIMGVTPRQALNAGQ